MTLTPVERQFLNLTEAALNSAQPSERGVDYRAVFAIANEQKLLPLIFSAALRSPEAQAFSALFAATKQQAVAQVITQAGRAAEFAGLYRRLREVGLHPILVKGQLLSRLYPLEDHRISADDDIYIPEDEFAACHTALLNEGFLPKIPEDELMTADEIPYTKPGSLLYIELHRSLFDSSREAHDELNGLFVGVNPIVMGGFLAMPPHEHMLYLILHAYKHFVRSGIGLRQFCDIGLWAKEYGDGVDYLRLYDQCASVHAATFAAAAFRIAREYLGVDFRLPAVFDASIDVEPLLRDAFAGGIYGSNDYARLHSSIVTLNAVGGNRGGETGGILRAVFPKVSYLKRRYPYLKARPYLLPVAWAQRIAHYVSERQPGAKGGPLSPVKLAKKRMKLMKFYDIK